MCFNGPNIQNLLDLTHNQALLYVGGKKTMEELRLCCLQRGALGFVEQLMMLQLQTQRRLLFSMIQMMTKNKHPMLKMSCKDREHSLQAMTTKAGLIIRVTACGQLAQLLPPFYSASQHFQPESGQLNCTLYASLRLQELHRKCCHLPVGQTVLSNDAG